MRRAAGTIERIAPLRHDAFEAKLARVPEDKRTVLLVKMLPHALKAGDAVVAACDCFPVNDAGT